MEKRTSAFARIFAVIALAGAVALVIVVVSGSLGDSDSSQDSRKGGNQAAQKVRPKTKASTYVVESGDTLISISRQTGIPLATILELNPEVDPQLLNAGETLKLR
jgi:LysM repeat protein